MQKTDEHVDLYDLPEFLQFLAIQFKQYYHETESFLTIFFNYC